MYVPELMERQWWEIMIDVFLTHSLNTENSDSL